MPNCLIIAGAPSFSKWYMTIIYKEEVDNETAGGKDYDEG
jgi:hypothetical protein